ncbi:class I SAM-dependent methyltransferase [Aestuariispira insulae]|uniref:Methyltransferase family protein n=1 Tax=Aestuariispira insulae TaxID=1461337 RepID=A0A3D9HH57_9PROT|nr:class I SAM-dependent methyltransferase [Aestuariispira insulae]RED48591.1 methyltransferase family protein [Aestuariispira insulae]
MLKLFKKKGDDDPAGDAPYIPFKKRFVAWWEGRDPEMALLADEDLDQADASTASGPKAALKTEETLADQSWPETRLAVCRLLWGGENQEEVVQPGGTEYTLTLAKPMALNEKKTVLDLASGLGGGTRRLSKEFNLWITGLEMDPGLAEHASKLSEQHGLSKRAPIGIYDPDKLELPDKKYHAILAREVFYAMKNKRAILDTVFNALKPAGDLVFTDFVLKTSDSEDNKAVETWIKSVPGSARPWTMADYKKRIMELSMDLHIFEDKTEEYRHMVLEGWGIFVASLKKDDMKSEFVDHLLAEGQRWLWLMRALESGELRYLRTHATRGRETI